MIVINKSQVNIVVLSLYQKTTLTPVYYLFEFTHKGTNTKTYCTAPDTSQFVSNYNQFTITDKTSPDPLEGEVDLVCGESVYRIYEQSSPTNLDPAGLNVVEGPGRCMVMRSETSVEYSGNPLTNNEYNR